jgi:hypothetical protein
MSEMWDMRDKATAQSYIRDHSANIAAKEAGARGNPEWSLKYSKARLAYWTVYHMTGDRQAAVEAAYAVDHAWEESDGT